MWPKALKMREDDKSGKSAYPVTIAIFSFYDFG